MKKVKSRMEKKMHENLEKKKPSRVYETFVKLRMEIENLPREFD